MMVLVCETHGFCEHDTSYCECRICWNPTLRKIENRPVLCQSIKKRNTKSEVFRFKFDLRASEDIVIRGYYNLIDSTIRTNTYATGKGIIGLKSSLQKNGVLISPEKILPGKEIILKARNRNIIDIKVHKNDVVAELRTSEPIYFLSISNE